MKRVCGRSASPSRSRTPFPYFAALHSANEVPRVLLTRGDRRSRELRARRPLGRGLARLDLRHRHHARRAALLEQGAGGVVRGGAGVPRAARGARASPAASLRAPRRRGRSASPPRRCRCCCSCRGSSGWRGASRDEPAARAALLALAFGSMIFPYALLFFSHALSAACAGGAFVLRGGGGARRPRGDRRWRRSAAACSPAARC